MLRTFFAIGIADEARREAAALVERLRSRLRDSGPGGGGEAVRWGRPEAFHVTLRFLGPTSEARVPALVEAVRRETAGLVPFTLALGAIGTFPHERRPRVVFVAVEPQAKAAALAAAVERGVVAAGFAPEERPFHPHLTLGRVREQRRLARLPAVERAAPAPFPVESLVLFRSQPSPAGSLYTPLAQIALGGVASP